MKHSAEGWWIEEAGAPAPCPPLDGPIDADVVIVGAGYLGMWTAWNLLARDNDLKIVILESGLAGHGPSGRNGGFVNGYWEYVPSLAEKFGAERSIRLAELADHLCWCAAVQRPLHCADRAADRRGDI
jgi:glycine/D-amino acid oxidase-like deaminating enzyme